MLDVLIGRSLTDVNGLATQYDDHDSLKPVDYVNYYLGTRHFMNSIPYRSQSVTMHQRFSQTCRTCTLYD